MKEIPILFSTPMVQAILDGRKTMTRRASGLDRLNEQPNDYQFERMQEYPDGSYRAVFIDIGYDGEEGSVKCPYGKPGDVLWVRETHALEKSGSEIICAYKASCDNGEFDFVTDDGSVVRAKVKRWRPAIHMLKETARIWLEVVSVKVERLQEITEQDAIAEGIEGFPSYHPASRPNQIINEFKSLWQFINGPDSWDANPWVWCVAFRKIDNHLTR